MNLKNIVNFIFELGQLKLIKHVGFNLLGVKDPDSVAEHVMRAAQLGYILAVMEGDANPEKVASIILIHDNGEARIGDQHKVAARYFNNAEAEEKAFTEQLESLGEMIKNKWADYFYQFENRNTKEGIIAKDADWLEAAFQAKQYLDLGHKSIGNWIDHVEKALETDSAKRLLEEMKTSEFTDWWQGLKKMTYKKLIHN